MTPLMAARIEHLPHRDVCEQIVVGVFQLVCVAIRVVGSLEQLIGIGRLQTNRTESFKGLPL